MVEAIVHQHLPIFHTEHCVFCRFLSEGNDYRDCGKPCEASRVHLRDSGGKDHLVLADMACRNTVFNAQAQSGAWCMSQLRAAEIGTFRVELVDEPPEVVSPLLEGYRRVLTGEEGPAALWRYFATIPDSNGLCHRGLPPGSRRNPRPAPEAHRGCRSLTHGREGRKEGMKEGRNFIITLL
eukprot:jgi/Botrbrau1/22190/Bobra.168_1s0022.1